MQRFAEIIIHTHSETSLAIAFDSIGGEGDNGHPAHTPGEWIALSQLERAKALLVRFLQSLP
jgi:di/tripeptidase